MQYDVLINKNMKFINKIKFSSVQEVYPTVQHIRSWKCKTQYKMFPHNVRNCPALIKLQYVHLQQREIHIMPWFEMVNKMSDDNNTVSRAMFSTQIKESSSPALNYKRNKSALKVYTSYCTLAIFHSSKGGQVFLHVVHCSNHFYALINFTKKYLNIYVCFCLLSTLIFLILYTPQKKFCTTRSYFFIF